MAAFSPAPKRRLERPVIAAGEYRGVHEPQSASVETVDLDGYDYRWLRARKQ